MVSVIIPAHHEEENIIKMLMRIPSWSQIENAEIIIAVSPESDISNIKVTHSNVKILECAKKGRSAQMNEGSALAKGSILVFLHADVIPPTSFLNDIHEALQKKFQAGFFSYRFDVSSFLLNINASFTGKDGFFTGGGDQCLFIEKVVFEKMGKFDEDHVLMEDFEFFKRMKKNDVPYTILQNDLIVSARKYTYNSYLRVNLTNFLLVLLFKSGYPSSKLKALHNKLLSTSNNG